MLVRLGPAPALLVVAEVESPLRLIPAARTRADLVALGRYVADRPNLRDGLALLMLERLGHEGRSDAWARSLLMEPGGIANTVVGLLLNEGGS